MATRVVFSRKESALVEQRQERRHRVEGVRAAQGEAELPFVAVLEDVSTYGCRLSGIATLEAGGQLWLRLSDGAPIMATVAWARGDEAGCRFATPISQGLMRSLLPGAI